MSDSTLDSLKALCEKHGRQVFAGILLEMATHRNPWLDLLPKLTPKQKATAQRRRFKIQKEQKALAKRKWRWIDSLEDRWHEGFPAFEGDYAVFWQNKVQEAYFNGANFSIRDDDETEIIFPSHWRAYKPPIK